MPNPLFADLVRELCHDGGTGPLTPTGAAPGHRRFTDAVPTGAPFHYAVAGVAWPAEWETGTGHIDAAGRLVRAAVAASSNGGAHVDFAPGLKTLALTVGADWFAAQQAGAAAAVEALAGKQPLSTGHAAAANGAEDDMLTVRRGEGWVNIPLAALAYRDGTGRVLAGGPLVCADGTAAAPAISFAADTDTGIYRAGGNVLGFAVGGAAGMRLTQTGLGIGVAAPYASLEISASPNVPNIAMGVSSGAAGVGFEMFGRMSTLSEPRARGFIAVGDSAIGVSGDLLIAPRTTTSASIRFLTGSVGPVERVRIAGNGNVSIGSASSVSRLFVNETSDATVSVAQFRATNVSGSDIHFLDIMVSAVDDVVQFRSSGSHAGGFAWLSASAVRLQLTATGMLAPGADNAQALGSATYRWATVYAGTGAINTSDAREKTGIRALTAAELRAGKRIAAIIGIFRFLASVAEKGEENAREHVGVIAQDVWAIMADEGLIDALDDGADPSSRYAFLCWDQWDEDGEMAHRFGIRADQLALFLIAAQEARLAALEAAA